MKKTIVILAALAAGSLAQAAETVSAGSYAVTLDFPYTSKYVFRGLEVGKSAVQPSVEAKMDDFYAGVWANSPLTKPYDHGRSREVDFYAGYNQKLSDLLKVDVGGTYYYYPRAKKPYQRDFTYEGTLGLNLTFHDFSASVYEYFDFRLHDWTTQVSVGYSLALKDLGTSLDFSVAAGRVNPHVGQNYSYLTGGVTVPYKLSDTLKVYAGVSYSCNTLKSTYDPKLYATGGFSAAF